MKQVYTMTHGQKNIKAALIFIPRTQDGNLQAKTDPAEGVYTLEEEQADKSKHSSYPVGFET